MTHVGLCNQTCNFQYRNPEAFLQDMALIRSNCEKFNG